MKNKNKILVALITVSALVSMTGFTAIAATKAKEVTFSKTNDLTVNVGYAITRTAVTTPEDLTVTYTSSDKTVVSVNENGKVTGVKPGKAIITASVDGLKASYNVTVVKPNDAATKAKEVFSGYTVTVNDATIPATYSGSIDYPITTYYFFSADNKKLGSISGQAYEAIMNKYRVNGWDAPGNNGDWVKWFADMFNAYRGLGESSRITAEADQIEEFRREVVRLTNLEREKAGLPTLEIEQDAMEYAQIRAEEISVSFSHTRPNEEWPIYLENIAGGPSVTPKEIVAGWMNSPGHRGSILDKNIYAIGVGCYKTANGSIYWTQEFVW